MFDLNEMTDSIESRTTEFLRTLGLITINFSALEHMIAMFIALAMRRAFRPRSRKRQVFQFELAEIITSEQSFNRLLTLLESLYKHIEPDASYVVELSRLIARAAALENERNKIVHSVWFIAWPFRVTRVKTTAKRVKNKPTNLKRQIENLNVDDLKQLADNLNKTSAEIELFMNSHGFSFD